MDYKNVPSGDINLEDIIKYGTIVTDDKSSLARRIVFYLQKNTIFAIVCEDEKGNLSLFPREIVNEMPLQGGLHDVCGKMEISIGNI